MNKTKQRNWKRIWGLVLALFGSLLMGGTAVIAFFSYLEPHSQGIHSADLLPVVIGFFLAIAFMVPGITLILKD